MRRMVGAEQARAFDAVAEEFDDIAQAWRWWAGRGEFGRLVDQMLLPLFRYATARFVGVNVAPLLDEAIAVLRSTTDDRLQTTDHEVPAIQRSLMVEAESLTLPPQEGTEESASVGSQPWSVVRRPLSLPLAALLIARAAIYANYFTQEFTPGDVRAAWALAQALGDDAARRLGYWYVTLNLVYGLLEAREPAIANLRAFVAGAASPAPTEIDANTSAFARQALARLLIREFAPETDVLEARALLREALAVFERSGNHDACASTYAADADVSVLLGRYDEALAYLERAQPPAESIGNWGLVWIILLNRREVYLQQGRPERMFPVFDEMLAMSRRVGNYRLECWTLSWDSIYALRYHSPERALFRRQAAMLLAEEFDLTYDRAWSALEIGDVYRVMGDAAAARRWFDTALPLFRQMGDRQGEAFYRRGRGDLAQAAGEWDAAYEHHAAFHAWADGRDTWARIYALCGMARAAVALDRPDEALGRLRTALHLAVASGRRDTEALPVAGLAHLAVAVGRPALAGRLAAAVVASPLTWIETRQWMAAEAGEQGSGGAGEMRTELTMGEVVERLMAVEVEGIEWLLAVEGVVSVAQVS